MLLTLVPERAAEQTTKSRYVCSFSLKLTQYYGFQQALNNGCLSIASSGKRSLIDCATQCLPSCPGFIFSEKRICYLLKKCNDLYKYSYDRNDCCPALKWCESPDVLIWREPHPTNEVINLYYRVNFCLKGGTWNVISKSCKCPSGTTGMQCESDFNTFNLSSLRLQI
ncbi:hypothetical protein PoB_004847700 [Plakobranchus ocellatus]|uniref:EGF-like domain-containing protein n=1 Tax=Plakobranchus ocellatus TaxID=259542 RepID=A0AAV4BRL2_9GAST|nr:hypothetical protein PoB_004847700 [Plakobranchus ocellatus]